MCGIENFITYPTSIYHNEKETTIDKFQLFLFDKDETEALCLDGSPGGLYFSKGYGDGKNKLVVHF